MQQQKSEAEIRERAYFIWEQTGRPHNAELDNWLQAEAELQKSKVQSVKRQTARRPRMPKAAKV